MEDLKARIDNIRGLRDTGQRIPVREFKGEFVEFIPTMDSRYNRTRVLLNFGDVEVIETTEPWNFPTITLDLPYSDTKRSTWGVYALSTEKFIPKEYGLSFLVNKRLHLKLTGEHPMWDAKQGKETMREAWEVIAVEGLEAGKTAPVDLTALVLSLLVGKTLPEFNQAAYNSPAIRGEPTVWNAVLAGTLVPSLEAAGKVKKDQDNRYQAV